MDRRRPTLAHRCRRGAVTSSKPVYDLHLKCDYFNSGVDPSAVEYKNFKAVMDRRNDLLHGNIDPEKDAIEVVYFDRYTPLFKDGGDHMLEFFRSKEQHLDAQGVIKRYTDVHLFFAYVISLLDKSEHWSMNEVLERNEIGYDIARGKPGILFPGWNAAMIMPTLYDDELSVNWK